MFLPSITQKIHRFIEESPPFRIFALLSVLGLLAFGNAVNHPFVHDDIVFIEDNPHIKEINLVDIFLYTSSSAGKTPVINTYWRPLLELFYRLEYKLVGLNPAGYHFINVLIHILNSFLIYQIMFLVSNKRKAFALALAVVFLIHPVQTEAVACVSGISNLLFTLLILGSLLLYVRSAGQKKPGSFWASLALFILALLTKEQAVILPFLILLYELCFLDKRRALFKPGIYCYFLILLFYLAFRNYYIGSVLSHIGTNTSELWLRLLATPRVLLMYLRVLFLPYDLHYYRSTDILQPFLLPTILLAIFLVVVFLVVQRTTWPKKTLLIFSVGWVLLCWGPVSTILPLINEYSLILTSEHFLYLPMVGVFLFLFTSIEGWTQRNSQRSLWVFLLVCVISLAVTIRQNTFWRGEIPLFQRTLRYQSEFGRVHSLLAGAYFWERQYPQAIQEYKKAYAIMSGYLPKSQDKKSTKFYREFLKTICFNMAHSYEALHQYEEALHWLQQAIALDPGDTTLYNNLGIDLARLKKPLEAKEHFEKALAIDPGNVMAKTNLATIYIFLNEREQALRLYGEILQQHPEDAATRANYQLLLSELKAQQGQD
ncbi:MAG TPA: tetratricopeptide repeat protein [Candidatus Omnitrophota bacterium]|nr:tetratricopeptide repeat protein [Candidatus Omnitrophota bacterium]